MNYLIDITAAFVIYSAYSGFIKEVRLNKKFWAIANLVVMFSAGFFAYDLIRTGALHSIPVTSTAFLLSGLFITILRILKTHSDINIRKYWLIANPLSICCSIAFAFALFIHEVYLLVPLSAALFFISAALVSFVRLKAGCTLPVHNNRIKHSEFLLYTFGKSGEVSQYFNIAFFIWFFVGFFATAAGYRYYGLTGEGFYVSVAGMLFSYYSIFLTRTNIGKGFLKGLCDLLTSFVVLYIAFNIDGFGIPLLLVIFAAYIGAAGWYIGTNRLSCDN